MNTIVRAYSKKIVNIIIYSITVSHLLLSTTALSAIKITPTIKLKPNHHYVCNIIMDQQKTLINEANILIKKNLSLAYLSKLLDFIHVQYQFSWSMCNTKQLESLPKIITRLSDQDLKTPTDINKCRYEKEALNKINKISASTLFTHPLEIKLLSKHNAWYENMLSRDCPSGIYEDYMESNEESNNTQTEQEIIGNSELLNENSKPIIEKPKQITIFSDSNQEQLLIPESIKALEKEIAEKTQQLELKNNTLDKDKNTAVPISTNIRNKNRMPVSNKLTTETLKKTAVNISASKQLENAALEIKNLGPTYCNNKNQCKVIQLLDSNCDGSENIFTVYSTFEPYVKINYENELSNFNTAKNKMLGKERSCLLKENPYPKSTCQDNRCTLISTNR